MSGGTLLRSILTTGSPSPTGAGSRVRADAADEKDRYPFIIFRRTGVDRTFGLDNTLLATREDFAIECWADTPSAAQALESEVVDALLAEGWPPTPNDPDGNDPVVGVNAVVVNVSIFS